MPKTIYNSEGEEYIAEFLKRYNIKYEHQKRIDGLKNDGSKYRTADFYLPSMGVYIEYCGQYFIPMHQERYKEKQKIYRENNIPCVYLFPENLGVLEFIFDKRLIVELKKFHHTKQLRAYRIKKFLPEYGRLVLILFVLLVQFASFYDDDFKNSKVIALIAGLIIGYQIWKLIQVYYRIFHLDRYPLGSSNT